MGAYVDPHSVNKQAMGSWRSAVVVKAPSGAERHYTAGAFSVTKAGELLGWSKATAYRKVADGSLPTVVVGRGKARRARVAAAEIDRLLYPDDWREPAAPPVTDDAFTGEIELPDEDAEFGPEPGADTEPFPEPEPVEVEPEEDPWARHDREQAEHRAAADTERREQQRLLDEHDAAVAAHRDRYRAESLLEYRLTEERQRRDAEIAAKRAEAARSRTVLDGDGVPHIPTEDDYQHADRVAGGVDDRGWWS